MAQAVVMPKAGISVESCIMGAWRVAPGDAVNIGDILFDYETDKAAFECESTAKGTLLEVFFEAGDEVPCLVAVCAIGQPGEDVSGLRPGLDDAAPVEEAAPVQEVAATQIERAASTGAASPRAKNLAARMKVNLDAVAASGPRGRIIERDVLAAVENAATGEGIGGRGHDGYIGGAKREAVAAKAAEAAEYIDEKMPPIRMAIAKSMTKSLTEIAQLTHHHSCDATVILNLRRRLKQDGGRLGLDGVTIGDMVRYA
ncbi:MAG: E3 binding domain-containing protein, partial [Clostridiales bacterium]|nr:E3 binding domain-containing protein [Clostridiales bacterium]